MRQIGKSLFGFNCLRDKDNGRSGTASRRARLAIEVLEDRVVPAVTAPAAPVYTAAVISDTQINLTWPSVTDATSYTVDEWVNGDWTTLGTTTDTNYAVTGLSPNTLYYFDVGAANDAGFTWGDVQGATTMAALPKLAGLWQSNGLDAQIQQTGATLTFTNELGKVSAGSFASATQIAASDWNLTGTLSGSDGLYTITWSDGTVWHQGPKVIPVLAGAWQVNGSAARIQQNGVSFTFTNDKGNTSSGSLTSSTQLVATDWNNLAGTISGTPGQYTITWANGSVWHQWMTHPSAAAAYRPANGPLFGSHGPSYQDVQQGMVGDCWLMASLAEVAARDPQDIRSMFTYDGTTRENGVVVGVYTVRLYDSNGVADYFTVDTELPKGGGYYAYIPANHAVWAALAEKAFVEAGWAGIVPSMRKGIDSYGALNGGSPIFALSTITGQPTSDLAVNPSNVAAAWKAGKLIVLDTFAPRNIYIVPAHAYALVGYNASSSTPFDIYNPWGTAASGWSLAQYAGHAVYGWFWASATTLVQNFAMGTTGVAAMPGGETAAPDVATVPWNNSSVIEQVHVQALPSIASVADTVAASFESASIPPPSNDLVFGDEDWLGTPRQADGTADLEPFAFR